MTPDQKLELYNAGFRAGESHSKPSPETLNFMQVVEEKIKNMGNEISEIKESVKSLPSRDEIKLVMKEGVDEVIKSCDKKYPSMDRFKIVEKIAFGACGAVLLAFLYAVVEIVIKK